MNNEPHVSVKSLLVLYKFLIVLVVPRVKLLKPFEVLFGVKSVAFVVGKHKAASRSDGSFSYLL